MKILCNIVREMLSLYKIYLCVRREGERKESIQWGENTKAKDNQQEERVQNHHCHILCYFCTHLDNKRGEQTTKCTVEQTMPKTLFNFSMTCLQDMMQNTEIAEFAMT